MNYRNLINECGKLVRDGIVVNDDVMPFTLIDFYSLIYKNQYENIDHKKIQVIAHRLRLRDNNKHVEMSYFINYLSRDVLVGEPVNNPMEIVNQNYHFTFDNKTYIPSYDDIALVLNIFDMLNIPKYRKLVYQALHRVSRNFPIFPLLEEEKVTSKKR